jgi:hypothetical protein
VNICRLHSNMLFALPASCSYQTIFSIYQHLLPSFTYTLLSLGLVGNCLNIIVLTHHKIFRRNPCTFYLTIGSIVDCVQLLTILVTCAVVNTYHYDPMQTSLVWCKVCSMFTQACTLISMTIVCLAVIDQYFSTHYLIRLRKISSFYLAQISLGITISIWCLHGIPYVLFFEIQSTAGCAIYQYSFGFYYRFFHLPILIGLLPMTLSSVFSYLAYRNVRRLIQPQMSHAKRRFDRQLTAMVLSRVIFLIIVTLPFVVYRFYVLLDRITLWQHDIEKLTHNTIVLIFSMNFSVIKRSLVTKRSNHNDRTNVVFF